MLQKQKPFQEITTQAIEAHEAMRLLSGLKSPQLRWSAMSERQV